MNSHIFVFISIFLLYVNSSDIINQFEEVEITKETQILYFENSYPEESISYYPEIIITYMNPNFKSNLNSKLVIIKTIKNTYKLAESETIVIQRNEEINQGNGQYKLIFTNYIGGKIIIYNSFYSFPLKDFSKLIYFKAYDLNFNFDVKFYSDILNEDITLNIYGAKDKINITKINDSIAENIELEDYLLKLSKGYSYNITYEYDVNYNFLLSIFKREIIKYDNIVYNKIFCLYNIPFYYFINLNELNNSINDLYFFVFHEYTMNLEVSNIENEKIEEIDLDSIQFSNEINLYNDKSYAKFNDSFIHSKYIILKITSKNVNFFTYLHIFENIIEPYRQDLITYTIDPKKETLLAMPRCDDKFLLIFSNNTNIRSLETLKLDFFDSKKYIERIMNYRFCVSILPSETPSTITIYSYNIDVKYIKDFSMNNFLYPYFSEIKDTNIIWFFQNNNNSIINIKRYFGNSKFYFSELNNRTLYNFKNKLYQFELLNEQAEIKGPFLIYIEPFENSFNEMLISETENNKDIDFCDDDNVLVFLKKGSKYTLNNIENNIRLIINDNLNGNIKIKDSNEDTKYILHKNDPYIDINPTFNDLFIISEEDTYIKIFHNIQDLYPDTTIHIIELTKENIEKGLIINIENINSIKSYEYLTFYGYKNFVPSNVKKITSKNQFLFINNDFEKMDNLIENMNLYVYIFGNNIDYKVRIIDIYKLNPLKKYLKIKTKSNYYFLPDYNYNNYSYSFTEFFFCKEINEENPFKIKITTPDGKTTNLNLINKENLIRYSSKTMMEFEYDSEFIMISYENDYSISNKIIDFYIPKVNDTSISLIIKNIDFKLRDVEFNYTIIIFEEKNEEEDDNLLNKLNNPCYFFEFYENNYSLLGNYNYLIIDAISQRSQFIYKEIDFSSKFMNNKNLYIKIISHIKDYKTVFYSKIKKIYLENINNNDNIDNNEKEEGIINIEDNKEYNINNNEYIFKYNLKKNHLNIVPVIFLTYYNTYYTTSQLEIINPYLQSFSFSLKKSDVITITNDTIIKDYGYYYFIFRNSLGVKFYLHNTINVFSLNGNIPNYFSTSSYNSSESIIYFSLNLYKEKYISFKNACIFYIYSKTLNKIINEFNDSGLNTIKIPPGEYLIFSSYEDCLTKNYEIGIFTDRNFIDDEIPLSREITSIYIDELIFHSRNIVIDPNSYQNKPYIILGNLDNNYVICIKGKNIDNILQYDFPLQGKYNSYDYHLINLNDIKCPEEKPYYLLKFSNTIFELITEYQIIQENKDIIIPKGNETIVFKINSNEIKYFFVFSNNENLQNLDKNKKDNSKILFEVSNNYQFKLNPSDTDTDLKFRIFDIKNNIEINYIKENEISDLLYSKNDNKNIKYYINLLKKDVIFSYYELKGAIELYLSKNELNNNSIEQIINSNEIDKNIFELKESKNIIIKPYYIIGIKNIDKELVQYSYMSSIFNDIIIFNPIKYLKENKKYILKKGLKVLLSDDSDAKIIITNYNNNKIYELNKENNTFENLEDNLIMKSDKDAIIYLFYKINEEPKLKKTIFKREYVNNTVLSFETNYYSEIYFDYRFENYESRFNNKMNLVDKNSKYIKIFNPYKNELLSDKLEYYIYSNIEPSSYKFDSSFNIGYNVLKINDSFSTQIFYSDNINKKNLFYQYINCENSINQKIELYINEYDKVQLKSQKGFIPNIQTVSLTYNLNETSIFNIYFTEYNNDDYEKIKKNANPYFRINFQTRNQIIIEILPLYIEYKQDYYIIYTIQKDELNDNLLDNICYKKQLIDNTQNDIIENLNYTKITLEGEKSHSITLNTNTLEDNYILYVTIFVEGFISDDIKQISTYSLKSHKIKPADFPEINNEDDSDKNNTVLYIIIFSVIIFIIILAIIILFIYRKLNKKYRLNNEADIYKEKLDGNLSEIID